VDSAKGTNGRGSAVGDTKEMRLALVCYGGSSLAVYMHGVTKELHRLVKGSALLDAELEPKSGALSEVVYRDLLRQLSEEQRVSTLVVVDVVAGTSAGGINGIYLAKALAHNRSQDALRDLWFERGDMSELLLLWRRLPVKLRLLLLLPRALHRSPLRGGAMARWLYEALKGMDEGNREPEPLESLVPEGARLDLFVTITDFYGYDRQVPIFDPPLVHDRRHRHALMFSYTPGGDDHFQRENNGSLAFAARTTSCFPGVFPPVSFEAFQRWVPEAALEDLKDRCFRIYTLAGEEPETTQFVDGGVLDNKPFGWAIGAIAQRPAEVEVDRKLLYLEPDPGQPPSPHSGVRRPRPSPTTLEAALGAASGIPRQEPLDDLLDVEAHNERVRRIRDVIETSFERVCELVVEVVGSPEQLPEDPNSELLASWSRQLNERTIAEAGLGYATYLRLKISGVVDRYAQTVCDVCDFPEDSNHAQLVRTVLRSWAGKRSLFTQELDPTDEQREFLRTYDLGYGERRLRFVTAGVRWWYRDLRAGKPNIPARSDLDKAKRILYAAVEKLRATMGGDFDPHLRAQIRACFPEKEIKDYLAVRSLDAGAYLDARGPEITAAAERVGEFIKLQLDGFTASLYRDLDELSRRWHPDRRRELLVRYLGFPLWDLLLYPIQALADAGENDEVEVVRLSPYEARVLKTAPEAKLEGKKLNHFWAFFDRKARENDYLWGRLDGAAHLIGVVLGKQHRDYRAWCLRAFSAILEEEERAKALAHIPETVDAIRAEVARG
jgi:patatin-related protein